MLDEQARQVPGRNAEPRREVIHIGAIVAGLRRKRRIRETKAGIVANARLAGRLASRIAPPSGFATPRRAAKSPDSHAADPG